MANPDLTSPLLYPSDQGELILTVDEEEEDPNSNSTNRSNGNHNHSDTRLPVHSENPYWFLGSGDLSIPNSTTIDPFRNNTKKIEGFYEWIKIVLCLPIAVARIVLFGVCLLVGYVATRLALEGWKDRQNPMPKWRCRLMWVTRFSARWILFCFG